MTMIVPSMCLKFNGSRCGCHIISFALLLISISSLETQNFSTVIKKVDAIISPKSRICFNSMSTSFQSECVYCDSKLYTSTMTACTGQPTLANNVTQAQAFCIATACLQVPVLNKAEPIKVANQFFANYLNKLNLFRPSLLFGSRNGGVNSNQIWLPTSASQSLSQKNPFAAERLSVGGKHGHLNNGFIFGKPIDKKFFSADLKFRPYFRQEVIDIVTDSPASNDDTATIKPASESGSDSGATIAPATASKASGGLEVQLPTTVSLEEDNKATIEYPNFNEMHSEIYSHYMDNNKKSLWRPFQHYLMSSDYRQRYPLAMNQMPNWFHSFTGRLAEKRANWWQTGKQPVVLGRKKRSLLPSLSFNLNKNKQKLQNNGTVTAQLNKSVNGTTSGNLAFVLNKPSTAYIWSNPLTRVFTKNTPNKSLQWQFGKGQPAPVAPAAASPIASGQLANPTQVAIRPGSSLATSGQLLSSQPIAGAAAAAGPVAAVGRPNVPLSPTRLGVPMTQTYMAGPVSQQYNNPASSSLVSQAADLVESSNGGSSQATAAAGSFVVLADEAVTSAARG